MNSQTVKKPPLTRDGHPVVSVDCSEVSCWLSSQDLSTIEPSKQGLRDLLNCANAIARASKSPGFDGKPALHSEQDTAAVTALAKFWHRTNSLSHSGCGLLRH